MISIAVTEPSQLRLDPKQTMHDASKYLQVSWQNMLVVQVMYLYRGED